MTEQKAKPKKSRTHTVVEAFAKGLFQATTKHFGPEAGVKMVEGLKTVGEAFTKKPKSEGAATEVAQETAPETQKLEPEEAKLADEDLAELERLVKESETRTD